MAEQMKPREKNHPRTHYLNKENRNEFLEMLATELNCSKGEAISVHRAVSVCFLRMLSEGKGVSIYNCVSFFYSKDMTRLFTKRSQALKKNLREIRERLIPDYRLRKLASMNLNSLTRLHPYNPRVVKNIEARIQEVIAAKATVAALDAAAKLKAEQQSAA